MNSRQLWHLMRVVVALSLVIQSLASFAAVPINAQRAAPLEARQAEPFVSPVSTPPPTPAATLLPTLVPDATVFASPLPTPLPVTGTLSLTATQALLDVRGGRVTSHDQRVRLDVPPGLFQRSTRLSITPRVQVSLTESDQPRLEFDLDAFDVAANSRLSRFSQMLTLTVNLSGVIDLAQIPSNMYVALYTVNAEGNQVPVWPLQIDAAAGTISAQIDHFSSWGAGLYPGTPGVWEFNYTAPEVALHSGAATAQIPLKVPAGRNSLQPHLALSYNSATLNGVSGSVLGSADWTRGSALGGFWELDGFAKIAREKWDSCKWGDDSNWRYTSCFKDVFTLILDGTGYNLVPAVEGQTYGRYYAEGGPAVEVYRYNNCAVHNTETGRCTTTNPTGNPSPSNETGEWWLVRLPDGTALELGKTIDAEQVAGNICNPVNDATTMRCKKIDGGTYGLGYRGSYAGASNGNPSKAARAWWVDTVTDPSGNTMQFTYGTFWFNNGERVTPRAIYYNNFPGGYLTRIVLNGTDTHPPNNEPTIDDVALYTKDANGVEQLAHRYWFTRAWFNRNKWDGNQNNRSDFEVLASVQEEGTGGTRLPAQTLTYEWRNTRDAYDIMQLTEVNNGYGGVTTFDYVDDMRPYGGYCTWAGCNDYVVSHRRVSTGGGSPDLYTTYEYGQVCHDAYNPGGPTECASRATILCGLACDYDRFVKLSGFGVVTTTQWDGATPISRSTHYFKNTNPSWLKGREYQSEQRDPANGNALLTRQETTWSDKLNGAWFAFASDQINTTYSGSQAASTRSSYTVDDFNHTTATFDYGAEVRVPNAGFENNTTDWSYWAGHTPITATTATAFAGRSSLMIKSTSDDYAGTTVTGLISGTTYLYRAWVRADTGSTAQVHLYVTDSSNRWIDGPTIQPTSTWTAISMSFVANGSTTYWPALWYTHNNNGGVYLDEVALAKASDVGDERSIHNFYHNVVDPARWFNGLKFGENTYATITRDYANYALLKTQTLWYYDDVSYNAALYAQSSHINRGQVTMEGHGLYNHAPDPFVTQKYLYDAWGNPLVITDTLERATRAEYDSQYHLYAVAITNALSQPTRYTYDKVLGTITSVADPNNVVTQYAYDAFGRLLKVARPPDNLTLPTVEYAYADGYSASGLAGLKVREDYREVSGDVNAYRPIVKFYDGLGRLVQERAETVNGTQQSVTNVTYDARGLTRYAYVPEFESFSWEFTRPGGWDSRAKTSSTYDALGRVVRVTAPDGTTTSTGVRGWETTTADANEHYKLSATDGQGRLVRVDEMLGNVANLASVTASSQYNSSYAPAKATDGNPGTEWATLGQTTGAWIQLTWGTAQTVRAVVLRDRSNLTDAIPTGRLYFSDGTNIATGNLPNEGGPVAVTFPAKTITWVKFVVESGTGYNDGLAEIAVIPERNTMTYTYDVLDHLKTVVDAANNTTTMNYDTLGRKTNMTDPDMGYWQYQYDVAGNLIQQTDAKNQVLWFNYDVLNRLIEKRQTNSGGLWLASYTYDQGANGVGRRTGLTDPASSATWTYDQRGLVTQETKVINGTGGGTFVTQYGGYDAMDRPAWMKYPGGNAGQIGEQVNFTYNNASQLNSVSGATPYVQSTTYDAAGRVDYRALGSNVVHQDYVYHPWTTVNGQGRLYQLKTGVPGNLTSLQDLRYTYDAVGNVLLLDDYKAGSPQRQTFHYDALDRLTDAAASGGAAGNYGTDYFTYTAIGNIQSKSGMGTYTYATACSGGTSHALPHAVASTTGGYSYAYDCNGNMVTRNEPGLSYTQSWDPENRLTGVTGSASATFVYDGDGNRVKATLNGVTTAYLGNYYEQSGTAYKKYYYAGAQRIAVNDNGTLYWLLGDHLGSTSITANSGGGKYAELRYKPWGEERYTNGVTTPTRRQYTGQIKDAEIGLYFYNARSYSAALGRFISADTMVPSASDPQQLNRYAYTRNNPLKYTDPTGHMIDDGCETEGCDTGEDWATKYVRRVMDTTDGFDPSDHPEDQLTLKFYFSSVQMGSREMASNGAILLDALHARNTLLKAHSSESPATVLMNLEDANRMLDLIAAGIVVEGMNSIVSTERGLVNAYRSYLGGCSFSADTPVATDDGQQTIATLKIGDHVLAYNMTLGITGYYTVTAVMIHDDPVIEYLIIDGEQIETTPEHPFYTLGFGWLPAGELWVGVHIRKANGEYGTVQAVQLVRHTQPMYNLTVAQAHTFFVGQQQWLVHNACKTEFGTWYGKGGWQNRTTIDGDELTVKQLTPRDVDNLGLHRSKRPFGAGATDNIYGDKNGGLWISNDKGFLSQFP